MDALPLSVLTVYLILQAIDTLITLLNLGHLKAQGDRVPAGFEGRVGAAELARMRDYTRARAKLDLVSTAVQVVIGVAFIFGPGLNLYNNWLAGYDLAPVVAGILFFLLLAWAETLLKIPFDLYHTFVIEARFGFNTQTPRLWLVDLFKSQLLAAGLLGVLLAGGFWLIGAAPHYWWLFTWLFFCGFSILLLYISPYVIEPLFNKFSPLTDEALVGRITQVMGRAGIGVARIFTMDASRRSRHGNAYFSGIGRVKRIVLFDTLLAAGDQDEIVAILAHEAGHWKKKHVLQRILVMETVALVALYAAFRLVQGEGLAGVFGLETPTMPAKLLLAGFLGSLVAALLSPLSNYLSRRHEWQADAFAVRITEAPEALARALVRLGCDNLANLHPHPWYAALHYSHPPLAQRVARLMGRA